MASKRFNREIDQVYEDIEGVYEYPHEKEDIMCLPCMHTGIMEKFFDFRFQDNDICIVSYPQSAFFWLQEVLWHLNNQDKIQAPKETKDALAIRVPFMEHEFRNAEPMSILAEYPSPRLMKSHLSYHHLEKQMGDKQDKIKIILWVLNPLNVITNYIKFWNEKGDFFDFPKLSWEKFYELFQKKQLFEGDWFDMHNSWAKYMNDPNVLILHYEDAAKDKEGTVKKVANFMGVKCNGWKTQQIAHITPFDDYNDPMQFFTPEQVEETKKIYKEKMAGNPIYSRYFQD